jgi:uncharacterized RDD family membrane protein YckC
MERIAFLPRLGAFLLDLGLFTAAVHLFLFVDVFINIHTPVNNFGVVSLLGGAFLLIGYGLSEVLMAATPGKRLAGLVIAAEDGSPAPRKALLKRWAVKQIAVFFACPMMILWTLLSPYNYHVVLPNYVLPGVLALAIVDTILVSVLLLSVIGGCFLALGPLRQTLHDKLAGTAVYRAADVLAAHAFSLDTDEARDGAIGATAAASTRTAFAPAAPLREASEPQNKSS